MWTKVFIVICLLAIVVSLFSALRMMARNKPGDRQKMARYLTIRVSISVVLLLGLGFAMYMGWIQPHGITPSTPSVP